MLLVDYGYISTRSIFGKKKEILEDLNYAPHIILNHILGYASQFGASKKNPIVIAVDSKPSWRHSFYVENCTNFPEYEGQTYKGDRIKDASIPWKDIFEIMDMVLAGLNKCSDFHVMKVPLAEADDIIAVLAKKCLKEKEKCFVISADKDFRQLQAHPYVQLYCPMKGMLVPELNVEEYKTLHFIVAGDDNIKNIRKGTGKAKALKLLPTLDEVLKLNPDMKARFEFNKTLIDFDRIPDELSTQILDVWQKKEQSYNYHANDLMKVFRRYRLGDHLDKIGKFKLPPETPTTNWNSKLELLAEENSFEMASLDSFFE